MVFLMDSANGSIRLLQVGFSTLLFLEVVVLVSSCCLTVFLGSCGFNR